MTKTIEQIIDEIGVVLDNDEAMTEKAEEFIDYADREETEQD